MTRMSQIKHYREQGLSWRNIGDQFGISGTAALTYYQRYTRPRKIRVIYQELHNRPYKIYVNKQRVSEYDLINKELIV